MGIAIVCIMLCHNTIVVPQPLRNMWKILTPMLQCGVDIFLLLSGLGLYYSFRKNPRVITFWRKRYTKILPPYIIVVLLYGIVWVGWFQKLSFAAYAYKYSLVTFYIFGELAIWFVAAILTLYAIFPILYAVLQKNPKVFALSCIAIAIGSMGIAYQNRLESLKIINEILVIRLPAFLVGMLIAKAILDKKAPEVSAIYVWLAWVVSTVLIVYVLVVAPANYWVIVRLLFLPFVLSGMLLLIKPIERCKKNRCLYRFLCFLGGVTLEIYLLHERILSIINHFSRGMNYPAVILTLGANILAIVLAILGAWGLQRVVCLIANSLTKRAML